MNGYGRFPWADMGRFFHIDDLQDLTDLFEYKELTRKSKSNQKEIDNLVKKIKKGVGKKQINKLIRKNSC